MTESITRIRGTGLPGPSPFGIMLTLLQIRLSSLLYLLLWTRSILHLLPFVPPSPFLASSYRPPFNLFPTRTHTRARDRARLPYSHAYRHTHPCSSFLSLTRFLSCIQQLSLSLRLVERPPRTRSTLTFGLLCNQNNNNCFGTFDYSSIRVTADCPQLRVGIARLAIRG